MTHIKRQKLISSTQVDRYNTQFLSYAWPLNIHHEQWGEAPTVPTVTGICMMSYLPNIITCLKFQDEIFRSHNFTGEFSISC